VVIRLLQHVAVETFTPFGKQIPNFADECRTIITAQAPTVVESLRVVVPRAVKSPGCWIIGRRRTRGEHRVTQ